MLQIETSLVNPVKEGRGGKQGEIAPRQRRRRPNVMSAVVVALPPGGDVSHDREEEKKRREEDFIESTSRGSFDMRCSLNGILLLRILA